MLNPQGHTFTDLIVAGLILCAVVVAIVVVTNPKHAFNEEYDVQRAEAVKDITEFLLEYRVVNADGFDALVAQLDEHKTMIGKGESCAGTFGVQCADVSTNDTCIDIGFVTQFSADSLPIDPDGGRFSSLQTGYALSVIEDQLIVSACNPSEKSNIEINIALE